MLDLFNAAFIMHFNQMSPRHKKSDFLACGYSDEHSLDLSHRQWTELTIAEQRKILPCLVKRMWRDGE